MYNERNSIKKGTIQKEGQYREKDCIITMRKREGIHSEKKHIGKGKIL